ncbi:flavin reductase family protein [Brevibacillus borstelensis]|uniref:flavin reductase family protein n=1 Tax=Brevibacillus borstelensis TaxID=45462 RepID=UPI00046ACD6D|nr:flavin reductase family protein [Brevibacillus borstelensis]
MKTNALAHKSIQPNILYYGTPVVLLTTKNEDGSTNISPISSSWALGDCIVMGIGYSGKAVENLRQHPECVLNLPDPSLWKQVELLAPLTGKDPVPSYKEQMGFRYEKDKFAAAGFTPMPSATVEPKRILECPLQIEAKVVNIRTPEHSPDFAIVEVKAVKVHASEDIVLGENYIDPASWSPLIYNFRHYFGLGAQMGKSYRSET